MMAGPTQARPMKQVPRGGALRFAISSLRITCCISVPPPPPTSFGHEKPTQPLTRTLRFQSARNAGSLVFVPAGRLSSRKARTSSRKASSSRVRLKSIGLETSELRDTLIVPVGVAKDRSRPLRALQVELRVVFPRVPDASVQADGIEARPGESLARIRFGHGDLPLRLRRRIVEHPSRVVEQRFERLDIDVDLGEGMLHALEAADRRIELDALFGVADG